MNQESLHKLKDILRQRCEAIPFSENAYSKWREICDSVGIEQLSRFDKREVLENSVIIIDPNLYGHWLRIPNETAEKILVLGLP